MRSVPPATPGVACASRGPPIDTVRAVGKGGITDTGRLHHAQAPVSFSTPLLAVKRMARWALEGSAGLEREVSADEAGSRGGWTISMRSSSGRMSESEQGPRSLARFHRGELVAGVIIRRCVDTSSQFVASVSPGNASERMSVTLDQSVTSVLVSRSLTGRTTYYRMDTWR